MVEQYDARLVEAVAEALEKLEDLTVQREICDSLGISDALFHQELSDLPAGSTCSVDVIAAALPRTPLSEARSLSQQDISQQTEHSMDIFSSPFLAMRTSAAEDELERQEQRARILQQLERLKTRSQEWLNLQRDAVAQLQLSAQDSPSAAQPLQQQDHAAVSQDASPMPVRSCKIFLLCTRLISATATLRSASTYDSALHARQYAAGPPQQSPRGNDR